MDKTWSELLFERYRSECGLSIPEHEAPIHGKQKLPDYVIAHGLWDVFVEIKQREPKPNAIKNSRCDPVKRIREEIAGATRKFKEFKDYYCALVIANAGDFSTWLEPQCIFAAMLGDPGFAFAAEAEDCDDGRHSENVFLAHGGKMISKHSPPRFQNRRISAVIALEECEWRAPESTPMQRKSPQTIRDRARFLVGLDRPKRRTVVRAIVCENPVSHFGLPTDMFCGAFDERWGINAGSLTQLYSGSRVGELAGACEASSLYMACRSGFANETCEVDLAWLFRRLKLLWPNL